MLKGRVTCKKSNKIFLSHLIHLEVYIVSTKKLGNFYLEFFLRYSKFFQANFSYWSLNIQSRSNMGVVKRDVRLVTP